MGAVQHAFFGGLEIGVAIGALMVGLPVSLALREPAERQGLQWKRAKWRGPAISSQPSAVSSQPKGGA